ncbi:cysteine desulfurase [Candidatus Parcubacteria bacterium]|nr:MAG: cysteine desulfurase [Candidatus Parcubacteria bacterium]
MAKQQRIYLDYAATTPIAPEVARAMAPYLSEKFGNPNSLHQYGQEARAAVDAARARAAEILGLDPLAGFREIIFTGSATEANNLALRGVVRKALMDNAVPRPKVLISAGEHKSVRETALALRAEGVEVAFIPLTTRGTVRLDALRQHIDERTVLVSVMYVNNETGAVQPIEKIAAMVAAVRAEKKNGYPLFHTDAVQAFQCFSCGPRELGVDMMTLSAHKLYGPKGVGLLYVRLAPTPHARALGPRAVLAPLITGGGQEFGVRSGTENVAGIVGFVRALELAAARRDKARRHLGKLQQRFWERLRAAIPHLRRNGDAAGSPHILNITFPAVRAEELVLRLDLEGIAVSSGSACSSRAAEASHVLEAMGLSHAQVLRSVRISFGMPTTAREVDRAVRSITMIFSKKKGRSL